VSALGHGLTGLGQGYLQSRKALNEQQQEQQLMELRGQQVGLQQKELEDQNYWRNRQVEVDNIRRLEDITRSPDFTRKYSPAEQKKYMDSLDNLYGRNASLSPFDVVQGRVIRDGVVSENTTGPLEQQPPRKTFESAPAAPPSAQPPPPAPAVSYSPQDREDAQLLNAVAIDQPGMPMTPGAFPQQPSVQQQSPAVDPATYPPQKQLADALQQQAMRFLEQSKNENLSRAEQDNYANMAREVMRDALAMENVQSETEFRQIQAKWFGPSAASEIGLRNEQRLGAEAERTTFRPRELYLKGEGDRLGYEARMAEIRAQSDREARDREDKTRQYELDRAKFGLSVDEFEAKLVKDYLDMGHTQAQIDKLKREPDWQLKLHQETLARNAYVTLQPSGQTIRGPTFGDYNESVRGIGGRAQGAAGASSRPTSLSDPRVQQYLADPGSGDPVKVAKAKVAQLKQWGLKPPPELIAAASKKKK
jgi:hypothetical protein